MRYKSRLKTLLLSMALSDWSCSLLSWRSQDRLRIQYLQGAYSIKQPVVICKGIYLAETKGIIKAVASDLLGPLKIWRHRHCNKAILYFVKHREARFIATVFKGAPTEVAQHRRNTIIGGVSICNPPCCPPLNHFYLVYIFLGIRAPHGGGIFNFGFNKCFIG